MCLYPRLIVNKKYTSNAKNGGVVPLLTDNRVKYVPIGCGNCLECRKQKAREWQVRLLEDIKHNINGKFITLTFSDKAIADIHARLGKKLTGYNLDNAIATWAIRHFLERWRKKYKKSLRHWLVTELGHQGTENIHLHGIIWTNENLEEVEKIWGYGFMWKGTKYTNPKTKTVQYRQYVNAQTVNYIIKYVNKQDEDHTTYKSAILTSAGIGAKYNTKQNKYNGKETVETYKTQTGHKISMPVYWRNKAYTDEQREQLWLNRLDKEERWVCGEKIDISTEQGYKNYWNTLKFHQARNKKLGYSGQNDEQRWEKRKYEEAQRAVKQMTRIRKAYAKDKRSAKAQYITGTP